MTNSHSPLATCHFAHDSMNRLSSSLISVDSRSFAVTNSYDLNGNRTNIVYPGGLSVSYTYDAENRLESVTTEYAENTESFSFGYDGASRLTNIVYPNGVDSFFGYDAESRVTSLIHNNGSNFVERSIVRDPRGFKTTENIISGLEPEMIEGEQRFTNDAADRITHIDQRDTWLGGELNQWYERNFSYDNNGCLTQENVTRPVWNTNSAIDEYRNDYTWDYDNRLTVVSYQGSVISYQYDASGVRIARITDNGSQITTNYFVIDYNAPLKMPLAETDAEGRITRYYVWSSHGLLAHLDVTDNGSQITVNAVRYYHADEQGSTLALTDETGDVTDQFAYTPYGGVTRTGTTDTPFQWLGGIAVQSEGAGLYYMLNRYYSATTKKFISTDPMGIDGGVNLYAYAELNPSFYTDSTGLWFGIDDAIFSVGGGVVGMAGRWVGDLITGHKSTWEDYTGSFVGGAAAGETLLYTANPVLSGAVGGVSGNATTQILKTRVTKTQESFDFASLAIDTGMGAATGLIPGRPKITGINAGRGSALQVFNQIHTKAQLGTIQSITTKTASKMAVGAFYEFAVPMGAGAGSAGSTILNDFWQSSSSRSMSGGGFGGVNSIQAWGLQK
jgi:RHS repeat-associated protein